MPTDNNHHRRQLYTHVAEAKSDLQCLANGLEKAGCPTTATKILKCRDKLQRLEIRIREILGPTTHRLVEDLSDIHPEAILASQENGVPNETAENRQ